MSQQKVVGLVTNISGDVQEINYHHGQYRGSLNQDGLPNGVGTIIQNGKEFTGLFHDGLPYEDEKYEIRFQDGSCLFTGTVKADNNELYPHQGVMYDQTKNKRYVGTFNGWLITEGKYFKEDKLVYEGTFSAVTLKDGGQSLWYQYGTMYFDDHSFTGYFKDNQPYGEGTITPIDNRIQVSIINSFLNIGFIIDGLLYDSLNKVSDRLSFPPGKKITLQVNDVDENLKQQLEACSYEVPQEKTNDYLDWDIDALYENILSQTTLTVDQLILEDGIHNGWIYTGTVNALMVPQGNGLLISDRGIQFKGHFQNGKREGEFEITDTEGHSFFEKFIHDKY